MFGALVYIYQFIQMRSRSVWMAAFSREGRSATVVKFLNLTDVRCQIQSRSRVRTNEIHEILQQLQGSFLRWTQSVCAQRGWNVKFCCLLYSLVHIPAHTRRFCSLSSDRENPDTRYLASLDVEVKSQPRLCSGGSMRACSVSLSWVARSVLVSENFPVMSFVGRFPSRTEKLNAKVLSDI